MLFDRETIDRRQKILLGVSTFGEMEKMARDRSNL
jgi:hypothetical protein